MGLNVQDPITAGQVTASYNASSVNDTDWHTLTSNEFYDAVTGSQMADGYSFAFVAIVNGSSSSIAYFKPRAAAGAGDGVANSDGVIAISGEYSIDLQALANGGSVTSIAYKKAAGGDNFIIYAGFNRG